MRPLIVTAAIIRRENKILIAQRPLESQHALQWEFPGGKLEEGETPEQCLTREIKEELNLEIQVKDIFKVVYHDYGDKTILLLCYLCDYQGGEGKTIECNAFQWVELKQLKEFSYVEADIPIVDKLLERGERTFEIDA